MIDFAQLDRDFDTSALSRWKCAHWAESVRDRMAMNDDQVVSWTRLELLTIDAEGTASFGEVEMRQMQRRFP